MMRPSFDLGRFRKIWKSDNLKMETDFVEELTRSSPLLEETLRLRQASVAVIDLKAMRYLCSIGDLEQIIGWTNEMILFGGVALFLSKLRAKDYAGLESMSKIMTDYVAALTNDQIAGFKSFFDFVMVRPDGSYVHILQEGVALRRDQSGNITLLLAMISNISHLKRNDKQHLRLTDGNRDVIYEVDHTTGVSRKLDGLSGREREIARMIGEKFTSEEIALRLSISVHTVNTHRQNILRKYNMTDMMEMNNFLFAYQIL